MFDISAFSLDRTLNIEGLAAALGIIGAAIAYIISLILRFWDKRKARNFRGTKFVILEVLEAALPGALSEEQIISEYGATSRIDERAKYGAWPPEKIDRLTFEREIKQLQNDFLIEITGKNSYRLKVNPIAPHETVENSKTELAEILRREIGINAVRDAAYACLVAARHDFDAERALMSLHQLGDGRGVEFLRHKIANGSDEEKALSSQVATRVMDLS